jgi:hypothetical protein
MILSDGLIGFVSLVLFFALLSGGVFLSRRWSQRFLIATASSSILSIDSARFHFVDGLDNTHYFRLSSSAICALDRLQMALGILHSETASTHIIVPLPVATIISSDFAPWLEGYLRQCPRPMLNRLVIEISDDDPTARIVIRRLRNMGCRVVRLLHLQSHVDLGQCQDWDGFTLDKEYVKDIDSQVAQQLRFRALYRAHLPNLHTLIFVLGVQDANEWAWLVSQGQIGGEGAYFLSNHRRFFVEKHILSALVTR